MKTIILSVVTLLCTVTTRACPYFGQWVKISIVDRDKKLPIQDAVILIVNERDRKWTIRTDEHGKAERVMAPGRYKIRISHISFPTISHTIKVKYRHEMNLAFILSARGLVVSESAKEQDNWFEEEEELELGRKEQVPQVTAAQVDEGCNFSCIASHRSRSADLDLLGNIKMLNEIKLFPNPATGGYVNVESMYDGQKTLVVYALDGSEVYRASIWHHHTIPTNLFSAGVYIIKMTDSKNDDVTVSKFMVK